MENGIPQGILDEVAKLPAEAKRALAEAIRAMVARELACRQDGGEVPACPHCGGKHVIRKGKDKKGRQRFLCKDCRRTFGATTKRILGTTKLPLETWLDYADGMAEGLTLRELATKCGICLKTSWFARMRLCEAMAAHLDGFLSGPGVYCEVDGTILHESLSGNGKKGKGSFEMPRASHKSGKSLHVRGVSGQCVNVVCVANDRGQVRAELMGRAHGTVEAIHRVLSGVLSPGTRVATDGLGLYQPVLEELKCEHEVRPSKPAKGERGLGLVNAAHLRLERFLGRFNGVSTRRLAKYLSWFAWTCQYYAGGADRRELYGREATTGTYESTIRETFEAPRFDMGYWEERGWTAA